MERKLQKLYCQYNFSDADTVIEVKLRDAMKRYQRRTGERITYQLLAEKTGLARTTIESIATRLGYNTSLSTIDKICTALDCSLGELLSQRQNEKGEARGR